MRIGTGVGIGLLAWACAGFAAEEATPSKISEVVLYRGQALVTRSLELAGAQGRRELVVSPLPEQVVADSLFAEGGANVSIRAVRYRTRAVGEIPEEAARALDAEIRAIMEGMQKNTRMAEVLKQKAAYLDQLEKFVAPTANVEMSKGVLNPDALKQMALFSFEQRKALADEELALAKEAKDLKEKLELARKKQTELASKGQKSVKEAVIFLEKADAQPAQVRLSYLADGAGWSSAYNLYAKADSTKVDVEYNAQIQQYTGEDWTGVRLTLSTAFPALSSEAPGLAPFRVTLQRLIPEQRANPNQPPNYANSEAVQQDVAQNKMQLKAAMGNRQRNYRRADNLSNDWDLNGIACNMQVLELNNPNQILLQAMGSQNLRDAGPSVNYILEGEVSLASRPDQQLVRISRTEMEGVFYFVATPLLTSYVYRQADIKNSSADALLGGTASMYLDGRFVGRAEVPTVAQGETLAMGFGAATQFRAKRVLVKKEESVQGGNRVMSFQYRLELESYQDTPAKVRVLDRLPVTSNENDIRVTLGETKDALSTDALYLRLDKPKGILRWEVEVPAGASGEKARLIEYGYKVEFDRNLALGTPDNQKQLREEFDAYQMEKLKF